MSPAKRHLLCTVAEVLSGDGGIRNKYIGKTKPAPSKTTQREAPRNLNTTLWRGFNPCNSRVGAYLALVQQ